MRLVPPLLPVALLPPLVVALLPPGLLAIALLPPLLAVALLPPLLLGVADRGPGSTEAGRQDHERDRSGHETLLSRDGRMAQSCRGHDPPALASHPRAGPGDEPFSFHLLTCSGD
jgi:hypothetical protein